MNRVEKIFIEKGINRGGIILYQKKDALDFVKECNKQSISILGIDGFFISEIITQPSLENSIDFSTISPKENVYEKAIKFIACKLDDLYFEIICA